MTNSGTRLVAVALGLAGFLWCLSLESGVSATATNQPLERVIVQGADVATLAALVRQAGGEVTDVLNIISAVGARLTPAQQRALSSQSGVTRIYADGQLESASARQDRPARDTRGRAQRQGQSDRAKQGRAARAPTA